MFVTTSRLFFDEFTGSGGGGVAHLNSCQGDKITAVIEGYFAWSLTGKLTFDSASKTISLYYSPISRTSQTSFITQGFKIGDTIESIGTASNPGPFTITDITDRSVTVAETVVNETANIATIHGTTLITAMDFYYNLIPNNSPNVNYSSILDAGTVQRYTVGGLDAAVVTPVYMLVGTDSYGWVPDTLTGDTSEVKIEGVSNAGYKQSFKITQTFRQSVIWQKELLNNFINRTAPADFTKGSALKHIFQVDGKFDVDTPDVAHSGGITTQPGNSSWFNQTSLQTKPEYSVASIEYRNNVTADVIETINASIVNKVTMAITSRNGKFVTSTTKFKLEHFFCPMDQAEYVGTSTTMLQNIRSDEKLVTADAAAADGINVGTGYQSLKNIEAVFVDANNVIVTFLVDYSTATKQYIADKDPEDRYFAFTITCQDIAITTTKGVDRVNLICDFKLADYDQRDATTFELIDYVHNFSYPNYGVSETNNAVGYEGDPAYLEIPFRIETAVVNNASPTLKKMMLKIVATKTGEDDFVLEEKEFDTSTVRKLNDKQTINIEDSRGFILADESPWNRADLIRYEAGDSGTKVGYKLRYGYVNRYEYWREVVQASAGDSYDVFKNIEEVTEQWSKYSQGSGWSLKIKLYAYVAGYDGFVTEFTTSCDVVIYAPDAAPASGPTFQSGIKYYNEEGVDMGGIQPNAKTRIVAIFRGDVSTFPSGMETFWGYVFVDNPVTGGIFTRRLASSDIDSESDSPFSSEDLPTLNGVVTETISANLRLSEFSNRIELDTWYTDNGEDVKQLIVGRRLGYQGPSILLQEDGSAILQEDGSFILL